MNYIQRVPEFKNLLSQRLLEKRYIHSLNVADSARYLAKKYGSDEDKAYVAGLLHDCTKNENEDIQLQMMLDDGIILSQTEQSNKKLWHAMSGPIYAKNVLKIEDEEILGAIRYHTTGKAGMNLLEKIIYIADFISAERDYPDVEVMRALADVSLDEAALYSLKSSLMRLSLKEQVIHSDSLDFYNELTIKKKLLQNEN